MPFLSMIRNEGKHKESAAATNSRKNVTHTFALKQQLKMCFKFLSGEGLRNEIITGHTEIYEDLRMLDLYDKFSRSEVPPSFKGKPFSIVRWVTFKGITYKQDMCVVLDLCNDGIVPIFGVIKKIAISTSGEVGLISQKFISPGYDNTMGAYEVKYSEEFVCIQIENLLSPFPAIHATLGNGKMFIGLRCKI